MSEALRLANRLDDEWWRSKDKPTTALLAAAELRRLHELNAEMLEVLIEMMDYSGLIEERCDCVATNKARAVIAKATGGAAQAKAGEQHGS